MEYSLPQASKFWFEPVNKLMDYNVYWFLQWYYLPMRMITKGDDVDRFISHFSLNGLKPFNICQK